MPLLAGLAVGVFVYLLVGYATGYTPEIKIRRLRRRAQISNRQLWLNQAGVAVTPRQFVAGSVAVGAVAFVAIVAVTGAPLVALVPAAGVAALPRAYFARRRTVRLRQVQAAWPDGLRDVIASIAAGRSLSQALNALAASGPAALQEAFTRFPMLSRMLGTVPALEVIKEELADPSRSSSHALGLASSVARRYAQRSVRRTRPQIGSSGAVATCRLVRRLRRQSAGSGAFERSEMTVALYAPFDHSSS